MTLRLATFVALLVLSLRGAWGAADGGSATITAGVSPAPSSPWLPVDSDLPTDPMLRDGTLPNGVRYLILPNSEPKGQVSLRLVVGVGSMHENDDERGLAHFVEHMAFRATREFPNGTMADALQRLGIAFGPDSTAFTSFVHTIYHLEVPSTEDATVRFAVHALREYASGVTFDAPLIEKERGVVLSEMATRDTAQSRAADFNLSLIWPASREVRRKVIGEPDFIRGFQRSQFVAFYDAWYRPERMAVIVVGDIDPDHLVSLIHQEFGPLVARAPARPEPPGFTTTTAANPDVGLFRDPDTVGFWVGFQKAKAQPHERNTRETRLARLKEALAFSMFEIRMRKRANAPGAVIIAPNASYTHGLRDWTLATVGVNGRIDDWKEVARELEVQHRTALQYGFTTAELEEARRGYALALDQARRSAATRPSPYLAQLLLGTLLNGTVFATPEVIQRDVEPMLASVTLQDCLTAFRDVWLPGSPMVFVVVNGSFASTRQQVAAVLNESRSEPVARPPDVPLPEFKYDGFGPAGSLVREEHLDDLDVHLSEFANGVRLNYKRTPFEADVLQIRVRFGEGKVSQLKSLPGIDLVAQASFMAGGVGRHTEQELTEILSGHAVQFSFDVDSDAFRFAGRCAPRELALTLKIMTAYISDAAFRPESLRQARAYYGSTVARLAASAGAPITTSAVRDMYGDDSRFGFPTYDEMTSRTLSELQAWMEPQLANGPIEVSIVGDADWPLVRDTVAATLGALGPRRPVGPREAAVPAMLAPRHDSVRTYAIDASKPQVALAWYWPVSSELPVRRERRCRLLANILADRMRLKLREELGATYGPAASFVTYDGFPSLNYFVFYAEVEPSRVSAALNILARETRALSQKGPTADEFERAKHPYVRGMADDLRTNAYWGGTVLEDAQQRPARIDAARNRSSDVAAITREELTALAREYLSPDRAHKFGTVPAPRQ